MKTVLIQVSPKQQAEALERHQVTEDVAKFRKLIKLARQIAEAKQ